MATVTFKCVHGNIAKIPVVVRQMENGEQRIMNILASPNGSGVPQGSLGIDDAVVPFCHDIYKKLVRGVIRVSAGTLPAEVTSDPAITDPVLAITH